MATMAARAKTFGFQQNIYSGQELRDRLQRVGFAEVELYGNYDGDPFGPDHNQLVVVAREGTA